MEITYTVISLAFGEAFPELPCFQTVTPTMFLQDLFAFLIILYQASRSRVRHLGVPSLLGTIVRDATKYFLVIFTAQFALAMTLLFGRVS